MSGTHQIIHCCEALDKWNWQMMFVCCKKAQIIGKSCSKLDEGRIRIWLGNFWFRRQSMELLMELDSAWPDEFISCFDFTNGSPKRWHSKGKSWGLLNDCNARGNLDRRRYWRGELAESSRVDGRRFRVERRQWGAVNDDQSYWIGDVGVSMTIWNF